jgi:hypothetical protein
MGIAADLLSALYVLAVRKLLRLSKPLQCFAGRIAISVSSIGSRRAPCEDYWPSSAHWDGGDDCCNAG